MTTPLEDHGGINPGDAFPKTLADTNNKVILVVHPKEGTFSISEFYNSLLLSHIEHILVCIPQSKDDNLQLPYLHPLFTFLPREITPLKACMDILKQTEKSSVFIYELLPGMQIPQQLWSVLRSTKQGSSVRFLVEDVYHQLLSMSTSGIATAEEEIQPFPMPIQSILQEMIIDTSSCFTDLCHLATKFGTDKSPYNLTTHRHPYTAVYDLFLHGFRSRQEEVKLGEIGVLNGASTKMWESYFSNVSLYGFDINETCLANMKSITNAKGILVDAGNPEGLKHALGEACADGKKFDILLEDASHRLDHQLIFLRDAIDFVAPGGVLIIEDIFRAIPAARFEEVLRSKQDKISKAILVRPEHIYRHSPGWENDRLLFVWVC